jgi:hypothetical protein
MLGKPAGAIGVLTLEGTYIYLALPNRLQFCDTTCSLARYHRGNPLRGDHGRDKPLRGQRDKAAGETDDNSSCNVGVSRSLLSLYPPCLVLAQYFFLFLGRSLFQCFRICLSSLLHSIVERQHGVSPYGGGPGPSTPRSLSPIIDDGELTLFVGEHSRFASIRSQISVQTGRGRGGYGTSA